MGNTVHSCWNIDSWTWVSLLNIWIISEGLKCLCILQRSLWHLLNDRNAFNRSNKSQPWGNKEQVQQGPIWLKWYDSMSQQEVVMPQMDPISEKKNNIVVLYSSDWLHQYNFGTYISRYIYNISRDTHITHSMPNHYCFLAMNNTLWIVSENSFSVWGSRADPTNGNDREIRLGSGGEKIPQGEDYAKSSLYKVSVREGEITMLQTLIKETRKKKSHKICRLRYNTTL